MGLAYIKPAATMLATGSDATALSGVHGHVAAAAIAALDDAWSIVRAIPFA
jgi:hypothetical protein